MLDIGVVLFMKYGNVILMWLVLVLSFLSIDVSIVWKCLIVSGV